jgi:hypothetical protein
MLPVKKRSLRYDETRRTGLCPLYIDAVYRAAVLSWN